ncbi:MAG TPA: aldo/keto reductase [Flexilinea sp.]|jgi:aryl-alcohol dehydrogenase-like predicted oxidoreductase|nr:aldo/keto reductase [Flexilinea sp.]HPR70530.1 aldo/keto reductase [Flexilinea sp.]HQG88790.1 aldo/keto reductase [Flexilinea sp.]
MKYIKFPQTDFHVSRICLGTMNFSSRCDYPTSEKVVKYAWEAGVNFFDTAAMYSDGIAETFLGKAVKDLPREKIFIVTKVISGVDKTNILLSMDESLRRLQMDYVDLFLVHWPLKGMNITNMIDGLNTIIENGKAKNIGVCNFPAYLLGAANEISIQKGWKKLSCNQIAYNLIERGVEVEILPQAILENIGIMVYRPLVMGLLTGHFHEGMPMDPSTRGSSDSRVITWLSQYGDALERFYRFAKEKGVHPTQLAIAWILHSKAVTAAIVGASSAEQLNETLKSSEIDLTDEEYDDVTSIFNTEVKEEGLQMFPGTKYNFPRLRRNLFLSTK